MVKDEAFKLEIPLDASSVPDLKPGQAVKVLVQDRRSRTTQATLVKLDAKGQGTAAFGFSQSPGTVRVLVGPESASDEEMQGLQTLSLDVSARQFAAGKPVRIPAVAISAYYWHWWLRWCRTFTIRGRVLCPDGSPVPGAKVCAYDVDLWWWWSSKSQVGCATTDASGSFQIQFRWCCGFWPWWWLSRRAWQLEPTLANAIVPVLQRDPALQKIPTPGPRPSLELFDDLLAGDVGAPLPRRSALDAGALAGLRDRLVKRLPEISALTPLRLWPWFPWQPWWDCTPDLVFKVTQSCRGKEVTIVDETVWDTRWNVPQALDVTLTANAEACCIQGDPPPEGNCLVISQVCDSVVNAIGGNPGATPAPAGYLNPGGAGATGDRPYAGAVTIEGIFGNGALADYYEFEWSSNGGATWNDMPPAAAGGFIREYWGPKVGTMDPPAFHTVSFPFALVDSRNVAESRQHFEAHNDPGSWGLTRFWVSNRDLLMVWLTDTTFADDTYRLRVKSWREVGGQLQNPEILPLCDTKDDNGLVLTIDNRVVGAGSGHPLDHVCGSGTVHTCTREPDTNVVEVRVNGVKVNPCDIVDGTKGGSLTIDFYAHDPDGHLALYSLIATYGANLAVNLLGIPGATLTPAPASGAVPSAAQVGPDYGLARAQGAMAPVWAGGVVRLTIPDLKQAFPESCAYQLELRGYKRTVVSCHHGLDGQANLSEYSFTIQV